ncbi:MAG TPA: hypothetical protein VKU00_12825 [Chthonomonadaceae bacterium]|nr:hypothetical protein [Chthonomonadaceae bacterium]
MPTFPTTHDKLRATTREQVIAHALTARTPTEIAAAKTVLSDWLDKHPDDTSTEDLFEVLALRSSDE